ncbi:hypothetical protein ABZZ74_26690 [Streptomyces sp. NPDC006476]|uniref:hypothetical protein n=1 Tax=Streptomyces sp. NPDC006476 TaxID=3157175 RepID=UPI0033BA65C1
MLEALPEWRQRAVETVELTSALWARHVREIHVRPLATCLDDFTQKDKRYSTLLKSPKKRSVEVTLPVGYLPRVPILDLRVTVAGKQVYRIPLEEGARLQGLYVKRLGRSIGLNIDDRLVDFLAALFYTPSRGYKELWEECNCSTFWKLAKWIRHGKFSARERDAVWEYLTSKDHVTGRPILGFDVSREAYNQWGRLCEEIGRIVRRLEPTDYLSAPENPLIALPHYAEELRKLKNKQLTEEMITGILGELTAALSSAERIAFLRRGETKESVVLLRREEGFTFSRRGEAEEGVVLPRHEDAEEGIVFLRREDDDSKEAARRFLQEYAICGFRWMVFVKCEVPRDEPFIVMMEETRPLHFTTKRAKEPARAEYLPTVKHHLRAKYTAWKMISFNDAETNHLSIRVPDTAARFHHFWWSQDNEVLGDKCDPVKAIPDEEQKEGDLYLRHDSTPDRASRIWVKCHLRLNRNMAWMFRLTAMVTFASVGILWVRGLHEEPSTRPNQGVAAEDAAVLLIPVAFSAAILLARDESTLGMYLRKRGQYVLAGLLFLLLASASFFYFIHHIAPHVGK